MNETYVGQIRVKLVFSRTLFSQSAASVSMGSLAAFLRSSGFQADLCLLGDRTHWSTGMISDPHSEKSIIIAKPNFKDYDTMFRIIEQGKATGTVSRIFFCGPFAKLNSASLMSRLSWLDGIFLDQAEASAAGLLSTMKADHSSWNMCSPGSISRNPETGMVGRHVPLKSPIPLSVLPFPARDIEAREDVGFANLEATRGCLFDCSFCHIPRVSEMPSGGPALNVRDPVLVVDEIERLNREMGKTLFIFNDSCFWSTKKDEARILLFCEEIAKRKLDVHFYIYLKGEPFIGDEVLHALVKAGLVRVFLGVENSVKSTLALYRKKIRPDLYETVRAKLDPLGVNVHIGYITVEPHSSIEDVLSNVEYLARIGKLFRLGVILEPVRAVPGTSLHTRLIMEGLMSPELEYDELTYGYRFVHEEVGRLLQNWKQMFECRLRGIAYGFEYHSTVGELLRVLALRTDPRFVRILEGRYRAFNDRKRSAMDLLLAYFRASIKFAQSGQWGTVEIAESDRRFADEFTHAAVHLAVQYDEIVSVIRENGGERVVREVYPM